MGSALGFWTDVVEPAAPTAPPEETPRGYLPRPGGANAVILGCRCQPPRGDGRYWRDVTCPLHGIFAMDARRGNPWF